METSLKILRREQTVQVSGGEHSSPKVLHMQRPCGESVPGRLDEQQGKCG